MRALPLYSGLLMLGLALPFAPHMAMAQTAIPVTALPDGQTILNIAATERTAVQQDLLMASLRIEIENADPKKVQGDINALMKKAVEKAKTVASVKTSTGQYYVYENTPIPHEKDVTPATKTWKGTQTLDLQSTTADELLKLAGELQDMGLVMGGLNYTLSPEKADLAKDALMEKALAKVTARAERAAKAMNKKSLSLVEVNVDTSDNIGQPYPVMRAMAMDGRMEKSATPSAEPGESEITLTVSAKALLKP